jgi:hypothetical protein
LSKDKWFFRVAIGKRSKLPKYEQELKATLQVGGVNQLNDLLAYSRNLFQDCLAFVRTQTKVENNLTVKLEFTKNQNDLNIIMSQVKKFAKGGEKPKCQPHAFCHWNNSEATIFVDFSYFFNLLRNYDYQTYIITLTDNYLHELIHPFFKLTDEQEVYVTQCKLLEAFLGIILPSEAKALKSSEFYHNQK